MKTDTEKKESVMEHLRIPRRMHRGRFALFLMLWKSAPPPISTDPFDSSESFRLIDFFDSADDAKAIAQRTRIDFLPGCALILDTETKECLRADNFPSTRDLVWVDGLTNPADGIMQGIHKKK